MRDSSGVTKSVTHSAGSFGWANRRFTPAWGEQADPLIAPAPNTPEYPHTLVDRDLVNDLARIGADLYAVPSAPKFKKNVLEYTEKYGYLGEPNRNSASAWAKHALVVYAHLETHNRLKVFMDGPAPVAALAESLVEDRRAWSELLRVWRTEEPSVFGLIDEERWLGPWELLWSWVDEAIDQRLSPRALRHLIARRCLSDLMFGGYLARSRPHLNPDGFLYFLMPAAGWSYYRLAVLWDAGEGARGVLRCRDCHRVFIVKRSDQELCGHGDCKQRAYRGRKRAGLATPRSKAPRTG